MKMPNVVGLVLLAVVITVVVEELRMSGLREQVAEMKSAQANQPVSNSSMTADVEGGTAERSSGPPRTKSSHARIDSATSDGGSNDQVDMKSVRKMWENPVGKSMMTQGVKMAVSMMYQDFIDDLGLTKEEETHFKLLLGNEMAAQQEIGMKMMGADAAEREQLMVEMQEASAKSEEDIKTFINNDADHLKFSEYKARLPERQQLDAIRSAFSAKGLEPLSKELETELVDVMHQVRMNPSTTDFAGPAILGQIAEGGMVERYERNWASEQKVLQAEVSKVLGPSQLEAFTEYQKQLKELQLMQFKMAEQMMKSQQGDE